MLHYLHDRKRQGDKNLEDYSVGSRDILQFMKRLHTKQSNTASIRFKLSKKIIFKLRHDIKRA